MIVVVVFLGLLFIGIGFLVTEENAKHLLSGYNTMSEEERQRFDIKSYVPYFRNFHVFLGISLFVIGSILFYFINADWGGIFIGTYPIIAYVYFIWTGRKFSKPNDKKQKRKAVITAIFMFAVFAGIAAMFYHSLTDNRIEIKDGVININGDYGFELKASDIESITLVDHLPEISVKTNGFALQTIKKGSFRNKNGENVKLLINSGSLPIILIVTNENQKIYYSSKKELNSEIFDRLQRALK